MFTDDKFLQVCERYKEIHDGKPLAALTARYDQVLDRRAELASYARRSNSQDDELDQISAELTVLEVAIADAKTAVRSQLAAERATKIAEISRVAQDPANLERPDGGIGAPALVKDARRDRLETADEVIQRAGNPWRHGAAAHWTAETGAGYVSRAHSAIEAMSTRFPHDGAEKLAELLSLRPSTFGPYERRDAEDLKRSAELVLALSNPYYESAFRSILRYPEAFRNGTGILMWSDAERLAYSDVMACRSTLIEDTGTGGQYMLPLVLDATIMLTNAGVGEPVAAGVPERLHYREIVEWSDLGRHDGERGSLRVSSPPTPRRPWARW